VQPTLLQQSRTVQAHPPVSFVDRDLAASLLLDFLTACKTDEGAQRDAFMTYAQTRAERQLDAWGVAR
jgi:hypothetical protein